MFANPHKRVARKVFVYYEEMVDNTKCSWLLLGLPVRTNGFALCESSMEETDYCSRDTPGPRVRIHTVPTLTEEIRSLLETHFEFVWVEGEISNFRAPTSGHFYMSLKDEKSQIRAVMFRMQARCLRFVP